MLSNQSDAYNCLVGEKCRSNSLREMLFPRQPVNVKRFNINQFSYRNILMEHCTLQSDDNCLTEGHLLLILNKVDNTLIDNFFNYS